MDRYTSVLKKYTQFTGRADKAEFWYFIAINFIISFVLSFVGGIIGFTLLGFLFSLAILLPSLAVGVRRMHDVGKSGWYFLIPFYNLYLAIMDSEPVPNQYGLAPTN